MDINLSNIKKEIDEIEKSVKPIMNSINVYTVTIVGSPYKENIDLNNLYTNIYSDYEDAKKNMTKMCKEYFDCKVFLDEFTDEDGNYCITFSEDLNENGYRVACGMAKLQKYELQKNKNDIINIKHEYINNRLKK